MATRNDYINYVKDLLVQKSMTYVPARENNLYRLTFTSDGRMSGEQFTNWQVVDDARRGRVQLRLLRGTDFCVWLYLQKDGLWAGKDKYNGSCELRPDEVDKPIWKGTHDFRDYQKLGEQPEKEYGKFFDMPQPSVDWAKYAWNINDITADRPDNKTAVALIGCNRPDYFTQVVQGLAQNSNITEYPVYCFLDKPQREAEHEMPRIHEGIVKEHIPHAIVIHRPRNFGVGRHIIDVREQLFDNAGYERVFMMEDDGVPSKTYLRYCESLLDWAESSYSNVGVVQGWRECLLSLDDKKTRLKQVTSTYQNWWGYLQNAQSWNDMKALLYKYRDNYLTMEIYKNRPYNTIRDWLRNITRKGRTVKGTNPVPMNSSRLDEQASFIINSYGAGQDHVTGIAYYLAGYERLAPVVNRMSYVGVWGEHSHKDHYESRKFGEMVLDEFQGDSRLKNFEFVG